MGIREDKKLTLAWLEFYGIQRAYGVQPSQVIANMGSSAQAVARFEEFARQQQAFAHAAGASTRGAVSGFLSLASLVPAVGVIVAAASAAVDTVFGWLGDMLAISCEKGCMALLEGPERRALVGIRPDVLWRPWPNFPRYLHDGLVTGGAGPAGTQAASGRVGGVSTRMPPGGGRDKWGTNGFNGSLVPPGLARGNWDKPWRDPGNNVAFRAWQVQSVLDWVDSKMPCAHVACAVKQFQAIRNAITKLNQMGRTREATALTEMGRRMGSRWYASLYYMQKDFWDMARTIGLGKAVPILESMMANDAARELQAAFGGKRYSTNEVPFPWMPVTKKLSWVSLRGALQRFSAEARAQIGQVSSVDIMLMRAGRGLTAEEIARRGAAARAREAAARQADEDARRQLQLEETAGEVGQVLLGVGAVGGLWWLGKKYLKGRK